MALPATGTVPTTSRDGSVEIDASTIEPVDPAGVPSGQEAAWGSEAARRATEIAAGRTSTISELDGGGRLNALLDGVAATYYVNKDEALDRLQSMSPTERAELALNPGALGELRAEPKAVEVSGSQTIPTTFSQEQLGGYLAVGADAKAYREDTYREIDQREQDRSTGVEPGPEMTPNQDPVLEGEGGQAPSTSGQTAAPKTEAPGVEKMMNDQVMQLAMRYDL